VFHVKHTKERVPSNARRVEATAPPQQMRFVGQLACPHNTSDHPGAREAEG
jgi:hypothetical protein